MDQNRDSKKVIEAKWRNLIFIVIARKETKDCQKNEKNQIKE